MFLLLLRVAFQRKYGSASEKNRIPVPMKEPVFKQRHFHLLALDAQESFEIICEYPLWDEFLYLK